MQDNLWIVMLCGMVYAALFWAASARVPSLPLCMVFGLAPFQNDISGIGGLHFSLSEVHLLLCVPFLWLRGWRGGLGWMSWELWGGLLLTVFLTLLGWRANSAVSLVQMGLYWIGAVAVFSTLPRSRDDFEPAFKALLWVGCVLAAAALAHGSSYFWGLHKNGVGASLSFAFILAVERWLTASGRAGWKALAPVALIGTGLLVVLSRGAWLAAGVGVVFILAWRGQYRRILQLCLLLVPLFGMIWTFVPQQSREYATSFDSSRYNIRARELNTEWAIEQWRSNPWLGVGAGLRKEYDATNVFWLTLAETGPFGLLAFLGVHGSFICGVWARRARYSSSVDSLLPVAGGLVAAKLAHGMVDHYWSRGAIMIAWASAGMALWEARRIAFQGARPRKRHPFRGPRENLRMGSAEDAQEDCGGVEVGAGNCDSVKGGVGWL
jgi:hypothetical protein